MIDCMRAVPVSVPSYQIIRKRIPFSFPMKGHSDPDTNGFSAMLLEE